MKTFSLTIMSLLIYVWAKSQSHVNQIINDNSQNYFTVKAQAMTYLNNLSTTMSPSLFYHEGSEYSQFKQWEHFWEGRLYPSGNFNTYFNNLQQTFDDIRGNNFIIYNTTWKEIGPTNEPTGTLPHNGGQSAGIGPVEFVRFYKSNTQHMLCGSTLGGLFYSNDHGDEWVNAGSDQWSGISAVSWAEFKVDDPEVIYASSSHQNQVDPGGIANGGIYRAIKNGTINPNTQWELIADNNVLGGSDCIVYRLLTDYDDPDILYAATSKGLFKSSDVNAATPTWTNILNDNIFDVEMHPSVTSQPNNHLIIYASFDNPSAERNNIWYSVDGGANWNDGIASLSNFPPYPTSVMSHVSIEVSDAFPDNIYLYFYGTNYLNRDIHRYNFSTQTSAQISAANSIDNGGVCCYGNGKAFGISQSGTDEVIFVADNDRYKRYVNGVVTTFTSLSSNRYDYHVDMDGFTFDPANAGEIWMGCHGGVYKSTDQGATWQPKMDGVGVANVFYMADSYTNPEYVLIGTYHDGCLLSNGPYTTDWNPPWKHAYGGDGSQTLIDNKDPTYMYASEANPGWAISTDEGNTFGGGMYTHTDGWFTAGALNKVEPNIIYRRGTDATYSAQIYRSFNHGVGNASDNPFISNLTALASAEINCSAVWSFFTYEYNKDLLIAQFFQLHLTPPDVGAPECFNSSTTTYFKLFYTLKATDPNIHPVNDWHEIPLPRTCCWIRDVELDPLDPNTIYVAYPPDWSMADGTYGILYKIENFMSATPTTTNLTYNLPNAGNWEKCLALEKGTDNGLYLATDAGVFYTNNKLRQVAGDEWILFGANYPHLTSNGLEINYQVNKIRSGIYGRGVWESDLYCPGPGPVALSGNINQNTFEEVDGVVTSTQTFNSGLRNRYRSTDEITLLPGFIATATTNSEFNAFIHGCDQPGNSFYRINTHSGQENENIVIDEQEHFTVINPASHNLKILFDETWADQDVNISLFTIMGQHVKSITQKAGKEINIPCSDINAGVYLLWVCTSSVCNSKKVVLLNKH